MHPAANIDPRRFPSAFAILVEPELHALVRSEAMAIVLRLAYVWWTRERFIHATPIPELLDRARASRSFAPGIAELPPALPTFPGAWLAVALAHATTAKSLGPTHPDPRHLLAGDELRILLVGAASRLLGLMDYHRAPALDHVEGDLLHIVELHQADTEEGQAWLTVARAHAAMRRYR